MRDVEYDRFGPWVMEISEKDPLPPLFKNYNKRDDTPLLTIKIPRAIDRADASPGMNLYDYVLYMYEEDFLVLKRRRNTVISDTIRYSNILCLKDYKNLLDGQLLIYKKDGYYKLSYNTVSKDVMDKIIDIILSRYSNKDRKAVLDNMILEDNDLDFYYSSILENEKKNNKEIRLVAYQSKIGLKNLDKNAINKLFYKISSKKLLGSLHLFDNRELKIVNRGINFLYFTKSSYARENCYIPIDKIDNITVEKDSESSAFVEINIKIGGFKFVYVLERENYLKSNYKKIMEITNNNL